MLSFLKNHPFAVESFFESSVVLTFAVEKEKLQQHIPERLQLDTLNDKCAFLAVAMVQTKDLRPKGFPRFMGNDFFLMGYRVFVRYTNKAGRKLRGLYILRSETDKGRMVFLGNVFTHYNYSKIDIVRSDTENYSMIRSVKSGFAVRLDSGATEVALPEDSPFKDWKEARRFAGPLPFTFTCDAATGKVLIVEGVRENWTPAPIRVIDQHFQYLQSLKLGDYVLANAFIIRNIPYFWKKGKIESW